MATALTPIQGQVLNADGRPARGQVVISWPFFQTPGQDYVGGETTYKIVDGQMSLSLVANQDAQPLGMFYTATFELDSGQVYQEYWIVPSRTSGSVTMGQCRVSVPDSPSVIISPLQLGSLGAQPDQFLAWNGSRWVPQYASSLNFSPITIGLLTGTDGTDVNWATAVPGVVKLGGNAQLNIPNAGPNARGLVTTGPQTFAGNKTFTGTVTTQDLVINGSVNGTPLSPGGGFPATYLFEGQPVGTRPALNFITGSNVSLTVTDDLLNNWVSIIIAAGGGGGGGGMLDPTSFLGDMIVRGPNTTQALARGTIGQVLTVVPTTGPPPQYWSPLGVAWVPISSIPWTSNVDAGGFALTNVSSINGVVPGLWSQSPAPLGAIYYNGGNVGVGTQTPSHVFTVINTVLPATGIASARFANDNIAPIIYEYKVRGTENNPQSVQVGDWLGYIGFGGFILGAAPEPDGASIGCVVTGVSGTSLTADLTFETNDGSAGIPIERMRITGNGRVGIGTANPTNTFTVINEVSPPHGLVSVRYANDITAPLYYSWKARGTESSPQSVQPGDWLFYMGYGGYVPGFSGAQGAITAVAGTDPRAADMVFFTNDGTDNVHDGYERVRITSDGRVGIGTAGEGVPAAKVNIAGDAGSGFNDAIFHGGTPLLHLQGTAADFSEPSIIFSEINYQPIGSIAAKNTGNGAGDLIFSTRQSNMVNPAERVRIRSTGDVGINTSSPIDPLTILGLGSSGLGHIRMIQGDYGVLLRGDGAGFYIMPTFAGNQYGGWSGVLPFCIDLFTGRVGIGTNSYINQLTVNGRSSFVPTGEPFAVQLAHDFSSLGTCIYVGTAVGGQFQVSNAGGTALMQLDQSGWGMTVWGNCNITGCYFANGVAVVCPSGSGVALSNVVSVNGATPGGLSNFTQGGTPGVNIQNTSGKPMWVSLVVYFGNPGNAIVYCDGNSSPGTIVARGTTPAGYWAETVTLSFIVMPNYFYRVALDTNVTVQNWSVWN